jgi:RNA polymerase sigma-70 factor (ECF subfamily)
MNQNQSGPRLAEMFSSYYEEVLAFCARRVGRGEAEDAAADVFAIAVRRAEEIDWATVRPWLYGIARGVLANRWRTLRRRERLVMRMATFTQTTSEPPADVVVRRAEDHEAVVALQRLRANDREILMLAAWEEMSGPEIAQTLGITVSAAEQRLHRAKKRYARVFDPQVIAGSLTSEGTGA